MAVDLDPFYIVIRRHIYISKVMWIFLLRQVVLWWDAINITNTSLWLRDVFIIRAFLNCTSVALNLSSGHF